MTAILTPPPPPRVTGDAATDQRSSMQWAQDFYEKAMSYFLAAPDQAQSGNFDPSDLPDPSTATVASAQDTANNAYILADRAMSAAGVFGTLTFGAADTTKTATFSSALPDTTYIVLFTPVVAETGTPASGAYQTTKLTKTTAGFTLTIAAAPGVGASVTYQYRLQRAPS
ncbi:hypothetical protein [Ferrovibrio terrae]|uniref:hypothetical protein n=1 Tax=Ferrovibrio terrae TaxID=2594003 RepID=UPI0031381FC5